jgi:hypothetical protein
VRLTSSFIPKRRAEPESAINDPQNRILPAVFSEWLRVSESLIRKLAAVVLLVASLIFIGVTMVLNYLSWFGQGGEGFIGRIFAFASIAVDLFKSFLPIAIAWAWATRNWSGCVVGTVGLVGCLVFSLTGAFDLAATSRSQTLGGREAAASRFAAAEKELEGIERQLATIGTFRPQAVVSQLIEQGKQDRRWSGSDSCNSPFNQSMRTFCTSIATLRTELASAIADVELRSRAKALHNEINIHLAAGVRAKLDRQAEIIAQLLGIPVAAIQTWLPVMVTLVLEFGAAFGLFLSALPLRAIQGATAPKAPPTPSVQTKPRRFIRSGGRLMIEYK